MKKLRKYLAWISIFSLILQISSSIFLARPAFAEEEGTSESTDMIVEEPTPPVEEPVEESIVEEPVEETPEEPTPPEPEDTPTPTPTVEVTPTEVPPEPEVDPSLIVDQGSQTEIEPEDGLDLDPSGTDAASAQINPELLTDKNDYSPSDIVSITGSGFNPNTTYEIVVTSETGNFRFSDIVTSDESGNLFYAYQLDGIYRPVYKIRVFDLQGSLIAEFGFTDPPVSGCTDDTAGANDEPGQKDLTKMCVDYSGLPTNILVDWNWDEINGSGSNTYDACSLYDTNSNGFANYSTCVTLIGKPLSQTSNSPRIYSCNDTRVDRCAGATLVTGPYLTSCVVSQVTNDPFPAGDEYPNDTNATCNVNIGEVGGTSSKLLDVCSFPSQEPNSDPSDCIVFQTDLGYLTILKDVVPDDISTNWDFAVTGPTSFNTSIVGDGSSGANAVDLGTYSIVETAGANTNLADYTTTWSCTKNESAYLSGSGTTASNIEIGKVGNVEDSVVCTFTNTLQQGELKIIKNTSGGDDTFNFNINGPTSLTPSILTSGGTGDTGFLPVDSGTYSVSETIPGGWHLSTAACVNAAGAPVGSFSTDTVSNVTVGPNDQITCTFNDVKKGSITVCKYDDLNGNGVLDVNDDQPLSGWEMTLNPGNIIQQTESNGCTTFNNLLPDNYSVTETLKTDWSNTSGGLTQNLTLAAGENPTINFLNFQCATISGMKWEDTNGNGQKDGGEAGAGGWTINLDKATNNVDSEVTASDGTYSFKVCEAGDYIVSEDLLSGGWYPTYPSGNHQITVTSGGNYPNNDFGNARYAKIYGYKYRDNDGDGVLDANDLTDTLAGWVINLYDGITNGLINFYTTLADGYYEFTGLFAGSSYYVLEEQKAGWVQTYGPSVTPTPIVTSSGDQVEVDFANFENVDVTVCKYVDVNGDGDISGDPLYTEAGGWEVSLEGNTQNTDDGCYTFSNIGPGNYDVTEEVKAGWIQTYPGAGSYNFDAVSGQDETFNFGNFELGSISGHKWEDKNINGVFDGSDEYLENWTIKLWQGTYVSPPVTLPDDTTLTDVNGYYSFENLVPGDYVVCEEVEPGWVQFIPGSNDCYYYTVQSGSQITVADFLNYQKGSIQGRKYEDLNANGTHELADGEERLNGWTVRLYDDGWNPLDEVTTSNTGEVGQYRFEGLDLGTYYVCEVLQAGWDQTGPLNGAGSVDNNHNPTGDGVGVLNGSGESDEGPVCWQTEINQSNQLRGWLKFGNFEPGKIKVCKYDDLDGDGELDEGEPGVEGVEIVISKVLELVIAVFNGENNEVPHYYTGEDGCYTFEGLSYGNYNIFEIIPPFFLQTYPVDPYHQVLVESGTEEEVYFLNTPLEPEISIVKDNDKSGGASAGDTVNYTLTLTNGSVPLIVDVTDVMPDGFSYVVGSGEVDGVPLEPTVSDNVLTWADLSFGSGEERVITYQAIIDGSQPAGTYYNLATCYGSTGEGDLIVGLETTAQDSFIRRILTAECDVVESSVPLGEGVSTTTAIGGTVLGVTIEKVLGAATGSETYWLVLALLMILGGVSLMLLDRKKMALLFRKLAKFGKKLAIFVGVILLFLAIARTVQAAVVVKVADLPDYKNTDNFKLYYTVLDTSNPSAVNAIAYVRKDGGFGWKTFGGTQTEPSGYFEAFGHDLDGDGTYYFYVQANGVNSSQTSTTVDREGPEAPKDYHKSREGATAFRIYWKNPSNSDYAFTRIFASTEQNFTADDSTKKADVGGNPDQEQNHLVSGLDPNKEYYFALQGFDKAGNPSGLVGDGGSVTYEETIVEVTPTPGPAVAGEGIILPEEEEGEGEEGEILGGEAPSPTPIPEEGFTGLIQGATSQVAGMNRGLLVVGAGILLVLAGLGYYFYRKQTS